MMGWCPDSLIWFGCVTKAIPHDSARRFGEEFCVTNLLRKRRNTLCISRFSQRICGGKEPPKPADAIVRCCLLFYSILPEKANADFCSGVYQLWYTGGDRRGEDVCPIFITCSGAAAGSGDGRYAAKPPLCKGRCRPYRAAEGLFPSGRYSRAASDYELLNSRAVRSETVCVAAIPQSATLTAPFTQRGLCAVRKCVPFPLAAQVRQWGPRGSPASAGSPGRGGAAE